MKQSSDKIYNECWRSFIIKFTFHLIGIGKESAKNSQAFLLSTWLGLWQPNPSFESELQMLSILEIKYGNKINVTDGDD